MEEHNIFDEDKAVTYIRGELPENVNTKYSDDDILYIVDCIWDYYEEKGMLDLSDIDEEENLDIEDISKYTLKGMKKAGIEVASEEELPLIIKAEIDYENTLDTLI